VDAVVVAGNDSGADVGLLADLSIAKVGEVVSFGTFAEFGLLGLNEVADMGVFADLTARAQVGKGANLGSVGDGAVCQYTALANQHIASQCAVLDHGVRADVAIAADARRTQQLHKGFDDGIGRDLNLGVDDAGFGPEDGDASGHEAVGGGGAQSGVEGD